MANLFWLNDRQWAAIEPRLSYLVASHAWMIVGLSAAFCTAFAKGYAGGQFRTNMARIAEPSRPTVSLLVEATFL
jgi:hypothetical protein